MKYHQRLAQHSTPSGVTGAVPFATSDPDAKRSIAEAADAMLDARFKAFKHASDLFTTNPTAKNWHRLKLASAAYSVAFECEHSRKGSA